MDSYLHFIVREGVTHETKLQPHLHVALNSGQNPYFNSLTCKRAKTELVNPGCNPHSDEADGYVHSSGAMNILTRVKCVRVNAV